MATFATVEPKESLPGRQLATGQLIALDAAAGLTYTLVLSVQLTARPPHSPWAAWIGFLAAALTGLPLGVRRLWPLPVFCVVLAASLTAVAAHTARDPFIAAGFALYTVAVAGRAGAWRSGAWRPGAGGAAAGQTGAAGAAARERPLVVLSLIAAGVTLLAAVSAGSTSSTSRANLAAGHLRSGTGGLARSAGLLLAGAAVLLGAWTLGRAIRGRRLSAAHAAARLTERAVAEERLRIARELHDVVAHSMGVIAVRSGIASHLLSSQPEQAGDALATIETESRHALTELRHMLGVLRSGDAAPGDGPGKAQPGDDLRPAPGLKDLPRLAEHAVEAGVRVELDVTGSELLPESAGRAVFRIVQEALTNVVKHAGPARCQITVAAAAGEVRIEVVDDGHGGGLLPDSQPAQAGTAATGGHGMIGMRERAQMYGGTFEAGPLAGGGFAVRATMPFEPARDA